MNANSLKKEFIQKVAAAYDLSNPTISRYFRQRLLNSGERKCGRNVCRFCGCDYASTDSRVRFIPKVKLTNKMRKLLGRPYATLGRYHRHLVDRYKHSTTVKVVICQMCKKKTKFPGLGSTATIIERIRTRIVEADAIRNATHVNEDSPVLLAPLAVSTLKRLRGKSRKQDTIELKKGTKLKDISSLRTIQKKQNTKKRSKTMHSQLSALIARENSNNISSSLKDFLTTL